VWRRTWRTTAWKGSDRRHNRKDACEEQSSTTRKSTWKCCRKLRRMMAVTVTVAADEEVYREREKKLDRNREEDFTGEKPSLNL